ncbi:hypothetical protein BDP27DRAFT_1329190 [Rhodocollybia butyracea]|uniref:FAD/NAD(P)-binding domain-containing protein n=1 Tax=Rhodocollybia butyracea TaxID=206335 RepID=A0A9P5PPV6_9AGAR|nr:hypothetical protein BDP27DRAFT_1329190 [Rhodocollybia butyracea]
MIFKYPLYFTTFYLSSVALAETACIVGAGPAGLTVAKGLSDKGYQTIVFDKSPQFGGKCQSYYDDRGQYHPMGALLFANETYKETLPIINASGVQSTPFSYDMPLVIYHDDGTTEEFPIELSTLTESPQFAAEIDKYSLLWTQSAPNLTIGYTRGIENFTMSTFDWLKANDLPLLLFLFLNGMIPYGYGDVRETPILYILTYMTPDILKFFAGQRDGYIIDFQKVFEQYAKTINSAFYLNSTITKIDRYASPTITYLANGSTTPETQKCDKLVLAFPPVIDALNDAHLDVSPLEQSVFSPVGITKYWSGAVSMDTPNATAFAGFFTEALINLTVAVAAGGNVTFDQLESALPDANGEPVAFIRLFNESSIATTWSWGKFRSNQTLAEAQSLLKTVLSKVNKLHPENITWPSTPITEADIKEFKEWDYFPHYDTPDLDSGVYARLDHLQGQQNTYYASGLNGFETVEFAIRAGNDIVGRIATAT